MGGGRGPVVRALLPPPRETAWAARQCERYRCSLSPKFLFFGMTTWQTRLKPLPVLGSGHF